MMLSARETATILASLRNVQEITSPEGGYDLADMYPDHFADDTPLNNDEIDALCEKINFYSEAPSAALESLCLKFIRDNEVANPEDIWQRDSLLPSGKIQELVEEICEILGYYEEDVW